MQISTHTFVTTGAGAGSGLGLATQNINLHKVHTLLITPISMT